jgi:hypothetical protein
VKFAKKENIECKFEIKREKKWYLRHVNFSYKISEIKWFGHIYIYINKHTWVADL